MPTKGTDPRSPTLLAAVREVLGTRGQCTVEDVAAGIGKSRGTAKLAIRDLRRAGVIEVTGTRRECSGSGTHRQLWALVSGKTYVPGSLHTYAHPPSNEERFWANVDKNGPIPPHLSTPCWVWTGSRFNGYGQFQAAYKHEGAHRYSYRLANGHIPDGAQILHHCDNPPCVRPEHLYAGTPKNNSDDCHNRGRARPAFGDANGSRTRPDRRAKGETHGRAKLTLTQAAEIRRRRNEGETLSSLASAFGVSSTTIHAVVHGRRYTEPS